MLTALRANTDFFSSHWMVVILVGLAFFSVQIILTVRFYLRMRRQQRSLDRLGRDFEQGGDGRGNGRPLSNSLTWVKWVTTIFPAGATTPPGNYSREEVLQELDTRIASNGDYLLLQRMGVMAPLVGVVLTVLGFYWLDVDEDQQSLKTILLAVTPLVSGVGTGAVLALVNQALLHIAGRRVESLRMSARTWFDAVIWSQIGLDTQAATVKAVRALERFAVSMNDSASQHVGVSSQIAESTASMKAAAGEFRGVVQSFGTQMRGIPQALSDVKNASAASSNALEELIRVGSRAVSNLDVSVAAFRTTLDREFATAAKLHFRSGNILAESVQQICDTIAALKSGADELIRSAQANVACVEKMDESIQQHVLPGNRLFSEAAQGLTGQVTELGKAATALSSHVAAVTAEFEKVARGIAPSVSSFCDAIDNRFGPAVVQHGQHIETVDRSMQHLHETAASLADGTRALSGMLRELPQLIGGARTTQDKVAEAASALSGAGTGLRKSIESEVAPSQRRLHEIAASLAGSVERLSEFTEQGLGPATRQLATLHDTLAGLDNAVASIRAFSAARADIDRLCDTLSRAAEISDAISALPEEIRDILEQSVRRAAHGSNSHGTFRTWLSWRPK